jgi:4-hydroxy-3-polyprenylbenzoate decarboxylase
MGDTAKRLVVGISGASGVIYGLELLRVLQDLGYESHVVLTERARENFLLETDHSLEEVEVVAGRIYDDADLAAPIASGSFITRGMVVIPCSIKSLLKLMLAAASQGAVILPPVPAFYHKPKTILDLIHHTVGKVLDCFHIPFWTSSTTP